MSTFFGFGTAISEQVIERLGWVLVHSLWQFAAVAMLAVIVMRAMSRSSAEARSLVLVGLMVVVVTCPFVTWMLQPLAGAGLLMSQVEIARLDDSTQSWGPATSTDVAAIPRADENGAPPESSTGRSSETHEEIDANDTPAPVAAATGLMPISSQGHVQSSWPERASHTLRPWLSWAVGCWVVGVVLCSLRPFIGWRNLRRLRKVSVSPASVELLAALERVSNRLGLSRSVQILLSGVAQVPLVIGFVRPVVLLPVSLVANIPAAQLDAILAHELAHIRRHDFVVNLLQIVVETLFFYHPAVWWLSHRIRVEREHCCDDLVIRTMDNRTEYGRALIAVEELRGHHTSLALGASDGSLLARIRRIAGQPEQRRGLSMASGLSVLMLLLVVAALFGVTTDRGLAAGDGSESGGDEELVADEDSLPAGSTLRFGTSRFRTGSDIDNMAVSANGTVAIAGHASHTQGFDFGSGRTIYSMGYGLRGLAISPDGKSIVAKGERSIGVHDAATGQSTRTVESPSALWNWTEVIEFTPDGNAFAVTSSPKQDEGIPAAVHLINFKRGKTMRVFPLDNPEADTPRLLKILGIAFSQDGRFMASGGYDNDQGVSFARLWEVNSGKEIRRFVHSNHGHGIRSLAFSPDGKLLATRSHDGRLRLFDVATGEPIKTFEKDGQGRKHRTVAFSQDGRTLAAAGDSLRLYDTTTHEERVRIDRGQVSNLHFTDGGKSLAGAYMGAIYRWDAATGRPRTPVAGDSAVSQIFVTPDEGRVITHGSLGDAHVWDSSTAKHLQRFGARSQRKIAMSPDGQFLAWAVRDETVRIQRQPFVFYGTRIRLYDVANNRFVDDRFPGSASDAGNIMFTRDGQQLITVGHRDGVVHVWNFETGREERNFLAVPDAEKNEPNQVTHAVLSPDGKSLVVAHPAYDDSIVLEDGTRVSRMGAKIPQPRPVRLWDMATGKLVRDVNARGDMTFSPDSRLLVSANGVVLEAATGREVFEVPGDRGLEATAFSQDGRFLATAVRDVIRIWDAETWTKQKELTGQSGITTLSFAPSGKLYSGHNDTTVLAWDVGPAMPLRATATRVEPRDATQIQWGEPKSGLRMGASFVNPPPDRVQLFNETDTASVNLYIQNVTDETISFEVMLRHPREGWGEQIRDSSGRNAQKNRGYAFFFVPPVIAIAELGPHKMMPLRAESQQSSNATSDGHFLVAPNAAAKVQYGAPFVYATPPGRYTAKFAASFRLADGKPENNWTSVSAGLLDFQVGQVSAEVAAVEPLRPVRSDELKGIYFGEADDFRVLLRFIGRQSKIPGQRAIFEGRWEVQVPMANTGSTITFTDNETTGAIDLDIGLWDGKTKGKSWRQPLGKVERGVSGTLYLTTYTTPYRWYRYLKRIPLTKVSDHAKIQPEDRELLNDRGRSDRRTRSLVQISENERVKQAGTDGVDGNREPEEQADPSGLEIRQLDADSEDERGSQPDEDGIYWSDSEKEDWVVGMKFVSQPTPDDPKIVVQHLLRNATDEARAIDLTINGRSGSGFSLSTQNRIRVDFGGGSWTEKGTVAARQTLQREEWKSTVNLQGLTPGKYSVTFGTVFFLPVPGQIGTRSGIPFRLHLPIEVKTRRLFGPKRRIPDESPYEELPIRWGVSVSGLRLGVVFPNTPKGEDKAFRHGTVARAQLFVQNVSAQSIKCEFHTPAGNDGWVLNIDDPNGKGVKSNWMAMSGWGFSQRFTGVLEPDEVQPMTGQLPKFRETGPDADSIADVNHVEFRIAAKPPKEFSHAQPTTYGMPAGRYTARCSALLRRADIPSGQIALDTGSVAFRVTKAEPAVIPNADDTRK